MFVKKNNSFTYVNITKTETEHREKDTKLILLINGKKSYCLALI